MRIPEDIDWVMALLAEAKRTGRNIQYRMSDGSWSNCGKPSFDYARDDYRVQPAPPQPKFRPMNDVELMAEVRRGTIVEGVSTAGRQTIGPIVFNAGAFVIGDLYAETGSLRFANPSDPRCGQPLQVEIKD